VLGLDNSGKTTVLRQLGGEDVSQVTPTQGFNVRSIQKDACSLNMWDIGGQKTIREYWRNHLDCTDVLIFVVDSSDQRRMKEASEELHLLLDEDKLVSVPLLVLANKQDLLNSISKGDRRRIRPCKHKESCVENFTMFSSEWRFE